MRTSQAPNFKSAGFSLIEVLIATAVAALTIFSASYALVMAEKQSRVRIFYREATVAAQYAYAERLCIKKPDKYRGMELQILNSIDQPQAAGWIVYEIIDPKTVRSIKTCARQ